MRMRQSLAEIEEAFAEEMEEDRERRERLARRAEQRARQRHIERAHKHGSMRFVLLVLTLIATAVIVTIAMFQTLYYVSGVSASLHRFRPGAARTWSGRFAGRDEARVGVRVSGERSLYEAVEEQAAVV